MGVARRETGGGRRDVHGQLRAVREVVRGERHRLARDGRRRQRRSQCQAGGRDPGQAGGDGEREREGPEAATGLQRVAEREGEGERRERDREPADSAEVGSGREETPEQDEDEPGDLADQHCADRQSRAEPPRAHAESPGRVGGEQAECECEPGESPHALHPNRPDYARSPLRTPATGGVLDSRAIIRTGGASSRSTRSPARIRA